MINPLSCIRYNSPDQKLIVRYGERHLWPVFSGHHYMTGDLPRSCTFFTVYLKHEDRETLVGCIGTILQIHKLPAKRITRFVILPEFQGLGLARPILDSISDYYSDKFLIFISTFHPRLGSLLTHDPNWLPSTNNMKEFRKSEKSIGTSNLLRDGVSMYRFKYNPVVQENKTKYRVIFDLIKDSKESKDHKEYLKSQHKKEQEQKIKDQKEKEIIDSLLPDEDNKKWKKKKRIRTRAIPPSKRND